MSRKFGIVIHPQYGGFYLTSDVMKVLFGNNPHGWDSDLTRYDENSNTVLNMKRHDDRLVEAVEKHISEHHQPDGGCRCNLEVDYIDVKWREHYHIDEYDGFETIVKDEKSLQVAKLQVELAAVKAAYRRDTGREWSPKK